MPIKRLLLIFSFCRLAVPYHCLKFQKICLADLTIYIYTVLDPKLGLNCPFSKKLFLLFFFILFFFFSFENYIHFYLFWLWYAIIIQNVQNMSPITTSRYLIGLFLTQNWVKMASLFNRNLSRKFVHATFVGLWYPIIMPNLNSCKSSM